tara:strand:- start:1163 stop:1699 length:537 start_codon:yes stop_codon:yes gene_type:complete
MNDYEMESPNIPLPEPRDEKIDSVILDNNYIIDELIRTLRGEIVDVVTNEIKQTGKPLVSEEAVTWLVGRFVPYVSKIFSLSVLDEVTIKTMIYEFESELSLELMFPESLGVERKNRDYVKSLMVHSFVATIYKAFKGETLSKLLIQYNISEQTLKHENEKQGWFKKKTMGMDGGLKI